MIVASVWSLTRDSLRLALDGVPPGLDPASVERAMLGVEGVCEVHHLHLWAISTTENAPTAHVVVAPDAARTECVKAALRRVLDAEGVAHATIETEGRRSAVRAGED